jgi:hypothetical protein
MISPMITASLLVSMGVDPIRGQGHLQAFDFYRGGQKKELAATEEKQVNDILLVSEKSATAHNMYDIISTLHSLANFHAPYIARNMKLSDPPSAAEIAKSEGYRLRAIALVDRLADNDTRIQEHRNLARWYRYYGRSLQESEQTALLIKLMGTDDRAKLFPPETFCPVGRIK